SEADRRYRGGKVLRRAASRHGAERPATSTGPIRGHHAAEGERVMATLEEIIAAVGGLTAINKVAEAVRPAEDTQDPFEALINLVLDDELTTVFRAPLKRLGYDLQSREFRNPFDASDPTLRKVSFATNARIEFYLALVPFWILDDGRREYQAAFALLGATFPKNSTIHMFARDLRDIDRPYRQMFESWQQDRS